MKATDLMSGDWVQHEEGICKVVSIALDGIYFEDSISEGVASFGRIKPIPITPEILENNGFGLTIYPGYKMFVFSERDNDYLPKWSAVLLLEGKFFEAHIMRIIPGPTKRENRIRLYDLMYVHELQHALRNVGIEKEIVL